MIIYRTRTFAVHHRAGYNVTYLHTLNNMLGDCINYFDDENSWYKTYRAFKKEELINE